ncbi:glycosyltransferase family 2 protein [Thermodesulfobacteriota bacterium]
MISFRTNATHARTTYVHKTEPRVHIMIYTFNKAAELRETLRSLQKTDYGNYKVFILNNGSSDGTERYIYSVKGTMFPELKIINLPVNVGAPAARNWLAHEPENRYADFVAYLDDDVLLPPNWLREMITTFKNYPDAGVVGAKILFPGEPKTIQHTGGIITRKEDWAHNIQGHSFEKDAGQHDYIAPRHYVMGCAQLYRREVFDVAGDYDLRFSPTQFDEVEQQIRMRLYGYQAIYNGFIEVVHLLKTGMQQSEATQVSREANRLKMLPLFTPEEIAALVDENLLSFEQPTTARCYNG